MNKSIDREYCWVVAEFKRTEKAEGRNAARRFLAAQIRSGQPLSPNAMVLAASIIDPDHKPPRGRRQGSHLDPAWSDIGQDFDDLARNGVPREKAYEMLADRYKIGERTIRKIVADWASAQRAASETIAAWEAEYAVMTEEEKQIYHDEIETARRTALGTGIPIEPPEE